MKLLSRTTLLTLLLTLACTPKGKPMQVDATCKAGQQKGADGKNTATTYGGTGSGTDTYNPDSGNTATQTYEATNPDASTDTLLGTDTSTTSTTYTGTSTSTSGGL